MTTMKKFARHRTLDELRPLCAERGITLNTYRYEHRGSDFIGLEGFFAGTPVTLLYSVFNGQFFGQRLDHICKFTECDLFDGEPWYAAILDLLFVAGEAGAC